MKQISDKQKKELALRARIKRELIALFGNKCMECGNLPDFKDGRGELHLSHTISLAQCGETSRENCRLLCRECHNKRHHIKEVKSEPQWSKEVINEG